MRALLEMGIFEELPLDGTGLSADVLANELRVERDLLGRMPYIVLPWLLTLCIVRLMRVAVPELFAEPEPQIYSHTPYSMVYLHPGVRGAFKLM